MTYENWNATGLFRLKEIPSPTVGGICLLVLKNDDVNNHRAESRHSKFRHLE